MKPRACALLLAVAAGLLFAAGCKSPGCVALIDIDLRTPEQIRAMEIADTAVFGATNEKGPAGAEARGPSLTWWESLFKMVTDIEGRIRLLYVAWGSSK